MSEEDVRKEIQRLNDLYIKEIDKKIVYSKEVVDCLIDAKTNKLQQENKQLKEELKYTVPIVEHNKIVSEKNKENQQLKEVINKAKLKSIYLQERYGYILDDLTFLLSNVEGNNDK